MAKHTYKPLQSPEVACEPVKREERYPSASIDVSPEQLKGLTKNGDIEIVLRGKLESFRYDSDDDWSTGANVRISLRSSEILNKEDETVIDELFGEDL